MVITIDGPTAGGKSSAAQLLAQKLAFYYLNSGLLYRALAYLLMNNKGYSLEQLKNPDLNDIAIFLDISKFIYNQDSACNAHILFNGLDITAYLKSPQIDQGASIISAHKEVRQKLLDYQRQFAQYNNLVADGRDMGTVVFPDAEFKFYLTASSGVRARRWMSDKQKRGITVSPEKALLEINTRDERDSMRPIAPLKVPEDAIVVDNTLLTLDETVDLMISYIEAKVGSPQLL